LQGVLAVLKDCNYHSTLSVLVERVPALTSPLQTQMKSWEAV